MPYSEKPAACGILEGERSGRWRELRQALGWNLSSLVLFSGFVLAITLVVVNWRQWVDLYLSYIDWHGDWWHQIDWLLISIFIFMLIMILCGANLRRDLRIVIVASMGGFLIESWGTNTQIWTYFTRERPPLWIIPAWPIATLAIDRLVRILKILFAKDWETSFKILYWIIFPAFFVIMVDFVYPTLGQSFTIIAIAFCLIVALTPEDYRISVMTFVAGTGLGFFLEYWGTTRQCWNYYTLQKPPIFSVLAHGFAAVIFWRVNTLLVEFYQTLRPGKETAAQPDGTLEQSDL